MISQVFVQDKPHPTSKTAVRLQIEVTSHKLTKGTLGEIYRKYPCTCWNPECKHAYYEILFNKNQPNQCMLICSERDIKIV